MRPRGGLSNAGSASSGRAPSETVTASESAMDDEGRRNLLLSLFRDDVADRSEPPSQVDKAEPAPSLSPSDWLGPMPPEVADAAWGSAASGQQRQGHNKTPRTHDKSKIGHPKKRSRRAYSAEALSRYHAQLED